MNSNERTPLVQKLILAVLVLILISLVVLIAQNRRKPAAAVADLNPPAESLAQAEVPTPISTIVPTDRSPRPGVEPAAAEPSRSVNSTSPEFPHSGSEPVATPVSGPPPGQVTLVNPVRPEPVDLTLRPQAQGSSRELCGRVRLEGTPPPEVPIRFDDACKRLNDGPVTTRHYVVGPERGLANVLVYVKEGLPRYYSPPAEGSAVLTTSGCSFEPYVFGVQSGKPVMLVNADKILHNFHATARNNREFNISLATRGSKAQRTFEEPELFVRLKCDVHPWEFAYAGVVEHPFFSVTDTNGVFCLPAGLPRGRYVLAAVHQKAGETTREIIINDDPLPALELALKVRRRH